MTLERRIATCGIAAHCAAQQNIFQENPPVALEDLARQAQDATETLLECAVIAMRNRISVDGKPSAAKLEGEQHAAHGIAWLATYVEAIKEMAAYAKRMREEGRFGETEDLVTRI